MELRLIIKALVQRFNSSFKLFSHIFTCVRRYLLFFMPSVVFFKEYMIGCLSPSKVLTDFSD